MKRLLGRYLLSPSFQMSPLAGLLRKVVKATDGTVYSYSPQFKLDMQVVSRPHYAWCMLNAAKLAALLGHKKVSAIEFGVAGGNGLAFMCEYATEVEKMTGVAIECYGFDTGQGMPSPQGTRDLPYWFQESQYRMDVDKLRSRVPQAKIVLGNIRESIGNFLKEFDPPPIGALFNDTDYWSSTTDSFRLYDFVETRPQNFLPRQFLYFDDVIGSEFEMYGPFNGQLLAIDEFNRQQDDVRIHLNQNLLNRIHLKYRHQIYYAHLFKHPDYPRYVGEERQAGLETLLKLT